MSTPLAQHQVEIHANLKAWQGKPLLRAIYAGFYERIVAQIDTTIPGRIVEIGSGVGNLKSRLPAAIATDLFPNPWLDLTCDGYELPFRDASLSHLILFDVFHHLQKPALFLEEAKRVLGPRGRVILFEPFISFASYPVYGLLHHEPVAIRAVIDRSATPPVPKSYYAAQGNATRLFFRGETPPWPPGWRIRHAEVFAAFAYLLSGGFSKPAMYPAGALALLQRCDRWLSRWPGAFGARCLIALQRDAGRAGDGI